MRKNPTDRQYQLLKKLNDNLLLPRSYHDGRTIRSLLKNGWAIMGSVTYDNPDEVPTWASSVGFHRVMLLTKEGWKTYRREYIKRAPEDK